MVNLWHDVDRKTPEKFTAIVECPKGSRVKYEVDQETGMNMYDRVVFSPMHYSTNYVLVPQTLWEDGDPLDVLILNEEALVPGCLVECRAIGVLDMIDGGEGDAKVLVVPVEDPRCEHIKEITDVDPHTLKEIKEFFTVYKNLQNKKVEIGEWCDRQRALSYIQKSFELYDAKIK